MRTYKDEKDPKDIVSSRRSELSLTQIELARLAGYPNVSFISMIESGRSKVPLEKAVGIANALEIEPVWFIERLLRQRFPQIAKELFDNHQVTARKAA